MRAHSPPPLLPSLSTAPPLPCLRLCLRLYVLTEHCECYFWERKLTSLIIAALCSGSIYLLLEHFAAFTRMELGLAAFATAIASGITSYVINSESHCHYESLWGRNERATAPYMGDVDPQ